jgi:hypothetical protein
LGSVPAAFRAVKSDATLSTALSAARFASDAAPADPAVTTFKENFTKPDNS